MNIFLLLSTVVACISPIIGIVSILRGSFRPQRMTRFLIMLVTWLFVGTLLAQGDRNGIFIALAQLAGSTIIFILSIKKGMGGYTKFDFLILVLALIALFIWQTTKNPTLGLVMSIVTDMIGMMPTLIKTWKFPETEAWQFYLSDVVASTFSILSITKPSFENMLFPVYILLINSTSVLMIWGRRKLT